MSFARSRRLSGSLGGSLLLRRWAGRLRNVHRGLNRSGMMLLLLLLRRHVGRLRAGVGEIHALVPATGHVGLVRMLMPSRGMLAS